MKKIAFLVLFALPFFAFSQYEKIPELIKFEKDVRSELLSLTPWPEEEALTQLSDSESREPIVIIQNTVAHYIEVPRISEKLTLAFLYKLTYKRVRLNEEKGVEKYNKIYIPVADVSNLIDLRARAYSSTGRVLKEFDEDDMKTIEEDGNMFRILALDGVEKGGEVEYFFITRNDISEYGDEYIQGEEYIRSYNFHMRVPETVEFEFKEYQGCPEMTDEKRGNYNIYALSASNVPVLQEEDYQDYGAQSMRFEYVLAYFKSKGRVRQKTFADHSKIIFTNINSQKKSSASDIAKLSKKLKIAEANGTENKIRIIENWIKSNIAYNESVPFNSMKELLKLRQASDLGMLRLYIYLFDHNQIKYEIWTTCERNDKVFDENFETFNFGDVHHLYFPEVKMFIDYKNYVWRLGLPPSSVLGQKAIQTKVVDLGDELLTSKYSIGLIQHPPSSASREYLNIELNVDETKRQVVGKMHMEEGGYQNIIKGLNFVYTDPDVKKEKLEDYLKRVSKDAELSSIIYKNDDLNDLTTANEPCMVDMNFTSKNLLETAGDHFIVKIGMVIGEQHEMYNEKPRQSPVSVEYPHSYYRKIILIIPENRVPKGLEKLNINNVYKGVGDRSNDGIGFVSSYKLEGNKLIIECLEYYDCIYWPRENYDQFTKVINSAADFNKLSIILEKKD